MSARDHTAIEELMAVAALGGLDPEDERALERERASHGGCEECAALETAYGEVAGRLAFALDPQPVDPAMADRILAQSGRIALIPGTGVSPMPEAPVVTIPDAGRPPERRRRWTVAVGIAAALILVAVASVAVVPRLGSVQPNVTAAQQIVHFAPTDGSTGQGEMSMAYTPGTPGAVVWGSDLPAPSTGDVYELWAISGTVPTSAGCMQPTDGAVAMQVDQDVSGADRMAVTEEPGTCPAAPTGSVFLTATLSS